MGASGWDYVEPFDTDLQTTFAALRQRVFDAGDYYWSGGIPRFETLAEWDALCAREPDIEGPDYEILMEVVACGTASILDVHSIGPRGEIEPLTSAQALELFGTCQPTPTIFKETALASFDSGKWNGGFSVELHDGSGALVAIGFWGASGD